RSVAGGRIALLPRGLARPEGGRGLPLPGRRPAPATASSSEYMARCALRGARAPGRDRGTRLRRGGDDGRGHALPLGHGPPPGRPGTRAVRLELRSWDPEALGDLLRRLGRDPILDRPGVEEGAASLRELSEGFLARHRFRRARDFVAAAYRAVLGRDPDPEGL